MNAASRRAPGRPWLIGFAVIAGLLVIGWLALLVLLPAGRLRAQFEKRVSAATGYAVTVGKLDLGWSGLGVALVAHDLVAVSADRTQRFETPVARMRVALFPLLKRNIVLTGASADRAVLSIRRKPEGPPVETGAAGLTGGPARPGEPGGFIAPKIEITNSRIVQEGVDAVTTLSGVTLKGSFRQERGAGPDAGSTAKGLFKGNFSADSISFAPNGTPNKPLLLPGVDLDFKSSITFVPMAVITEIDGKWGSWPGKGTIQTAFDAGLGGWRNNGQFTLENTDIDKLTGLVANAGPALRDYDLGGRLEDGQVHFETRPDSDEMQYDFRANFRKVKASLPGKGEVVRDGNGELHLTPNNLNLTGAFAMGRARLNLDAHVAQFDHPKWTAQVKLAGPADEALRFLPPERTFNATGGTLDVDMSVSGQVTGGRDERGGIVGANGIVRVEKLALQVPGLAVPVNRLDLTIHLLSRSARLEQGFVSAGGSRARFSGALPDLNRPELALDVAAETLNFDELFPKENGGAPPGPGGETKAAALPVSGRITADKLIRDRLTITDASARFSAGAAGVELKDLGGSVYGGTVSGEMTMTPAGTGTWNYTGRFIVADARIDDLLAALTPIHGIEGRVRTRFNLAGRTGPGIDPKKSLTMEATGIILDGALVNIPAIEKVSRILKFKEAAPERFAFRTMRHRVHVENGFAVLDTLHLSQPSADWDLSGRVGLDGSLDCPVVAHLDPAIFEEGTNYRTAAQVLAGPDGRLALAFHLGGTVSSPDVSINLDPLTEAATKKASDALTDELKKRLGGLLRKP